MFCIDKFSLISQFKMMNTLTQPRYNRGRIHPKKFALWVGLVSIIMMFTALTSAYIVRRSAGNWLDFKLPNLFFVSTAAIIASSFVLHFAYKAWQQGKEQLYKRLLAGGLLFGLLFVGLQYEAWMQLYDLNITLQRNPSASFLYLITGLHVLHVVGGIGALTVLAVFAFRRRMVEVTPKRQLRWELILTYWHFVDFLWIYLLVFLLIQQ